MVIGMIDRHMNLTYVNGINYKWVRSHYRSQWKGIVLGEKSWPDSKYKSLIVLIIFDKSNHRLLNRRIKSLSEGWLEKIPPIDVDIIEDWLQT